MVKRLLGLLGWLGVALVFAAVAIRLLKPEWQQWYSGLALAGLACTLLYILSQWREVARAFSGRQARYGTLSLASIIVVLAILAAINYLASRHNKRWDLTSAKQFTLSDQTRKVLEGLARPVNVRVFAKPDDFDRFRQRLDEYQYMSKQLKVEYVDIDRPQAKAFGVQQPTILFEYEGRTERVTSDAEQDVTNGLIKVVSGKTPKVYFVQGHGERNPDNTDPSGYKGITTQLQSDNFVFEKLVLAQVKEVPADAAVLITAGPKTDFFPGEMETLKAYLAKGGKVLFLLDPAEKADSPRPANLEALLKEWAIELGDNVVVDVSGMGQLSLGTGPSVPVAATYESHPITERFELITAYPLARSVSSASAGANNRFATNLVNTSRESWAETDIKRLTSTGEVKPEPDKGDKQGPISLAAAVSAAVGDAPPATPEPGKDAAPRPETRIAVFGDSDFVSNRWLGIQGNRDLFLNTVNWLAQQEHLISIRPRDPEDRRVTLTAQQERWIFFLTVLIIPGLILAAGVQTWWRRR